MLKLRQLSVSLVLSFFTLTPSIAVKVGVIVPMQHAAMDEIVSGLQETLAPNLSETDVLIVQNANGDQTLQHQIIQQMKLAGVDYFLPIGTSTSHMTLSLITSRPVICVAALINPETFKKISLKRVGVINDEIGVSQLLRFIKHHLTDIKKLGLIYSNSEKVFPEVKQAQEFCQKNGFSLVLRKVDSVAEVYQYARLLVPQVDAVLILKDHMVVSAMSGLSALAKTHQKLVIAMDDGSVKNGAHFGLGVLERDIGIAAATQLMEALKGNDTTAFTLSTLDKLSVFYNPQSLSGQTTISLDRLKEAAKKEGYACHAVRDEKKRKG